MSNALAAFQPHQPRLLRIAYRMLGSMSDAEDVVQDAYLRWHELQASDHGEPVRSSEAFLSISSASMVRSASCSLGRGVT